MKLLHLFFLLTIFGNVSAQYPTLPSDTLPVIHEMVGKVDTTTFLNDVRQLQEFGTRECFTPEAVEAQNWIKSKFESFGLEVELQDFSVWTLNPSDNVIATLPGKVTPEEYIVLGAHYDSYGGGPLAPGADDNASGTAGVMETARILSQYETEKTIIFCAFSAEEYGLFGSEAYASRCEQLGMNILGYFNMDMIGYHHPGDELHSDMIAPSSAQPLADFYKSAAGIYVPGFPIYDGYLSGGDSDHTSFNNHGYMGIFPFEDDQFHSPFIHSPGDTIGTSFNSAMLAMKLIQCALASAAALSVPYNPVGFSDSSPELTLSVYPNPSNGNLWIRLNKPVDATYEVFSFSGQSVGNGSFTGSVLINLQGLAAGNYLVRVVGDQINLTRKLVKN